MDFISDGDANFYQNFVQSVITVDCYPEFIVQYLYFQNGKYKWINIFHISKMGKNSPEITYQKLVKIK